MPFRANGFTEHAVVVPALYVALGVAVLGLFGLWEPLWQFGATLIERTRG